MDRFLAEMLDVHYRVATAFTGEEGLARAATHPDLIAAKRVPASTMGAMRFQLALASLALAACSGGSASIDGSTGDASTAGDAAIGPAGWAECLARAGATTDTIAGVQDRYRNDDAPDDWNLDLTGAHLTGYPAVTTTPMNIGSGDPARRDCVGGGVVVGQQSRTLTWNEMHDVIGGGGFRVTNFCRPVHPTTTLGVSSGSTNDVTSIRAVRSASPDGRTG